VTFEWEKIAQITSEPLLQKTIYFKETAFLTIQGLYIQVRVFQSAPCVFSSLTVLLSFSPRVSATVFSEGSSTSILPLTRWTIQGAFSIISLVVVCLISLAVE